MKKQVRTFLRRAWDEGLEGRVLMVQDRLRAARDMPADHRKALEELAIGAAPRPTLSFPESMTIH